MTNDIKNILNKLGIEDTGTYDNHFYEIKLSDSDDYSKMYTKLSETANNAEYPSFGTNTNNTTIKITNYFEIDEANVSYNIFLIADFDKDEYTLRIGEK